MGSMESGAERGENAAGGCCAPAAERGGVTAAVSVEGREPKEEMLARMVELPGGTFLMGTDTAEGFAQDGGAGWVGVCVLVAYSKGTV